MYSNRMIMTYLDLGLPLTFLLLGVFSLLRFSEVERDSDAMELVDGIVGERMQDRLGPG